MRDFKKLLSDFEEIEQVSKLFHTSFTKKTDFPQNFVSQTIDIWQAV